MKSLTIFFLTLGIMSSKVQSQDIETESVDLDNLIDFIAENYAHQEEDDLEFYNFTFALQVANSEMNVENRFILKQAFKLLSERLNKNSTISIVGYYGLNGMLLEQVSVKDLDDINQVIENIKESANELVDEGITLSYKHAKEIYNEDALNTVFIIRNDDAVEKGLVVMSREEEKKLKRKKRNKAILQTAVTLLPELISLIDK